MEQVEDYIHKVCVGEGECSQPISVEEAPTSVPHGAQGMVLGFFPSKSMGETVEFFQT